MQLREMKTVRVYPDLVQKKCSHTDANKDQLCRMCTGPASFPKNLSFHYSQNAFKRGTEKKVER